MNIRFLEPARNEIDDAFDWYEMEQCGLGHRFLSEIQSAMKRITVFPDSCSIIAPGLRRCMTRKFPYMLVYGLEQDTVVIVAVAHMHRIPLYWHGR
jgi:plasmid stabilization system protein ParE